MNWPLPGALTECYFSNEASADRRSSLSRPGREIRGLRVEDVDLIERWVIVRRGKGGKGRVIPIRGRVVRLFEEFMLTPIPKLGRAPQRLRHEARARVRKLGGRPEGSRPRVDPNNK